jgi:glutamate-1-semialdehyde 2,1-aminomutase
MKKSVSEELYQEALNYFPGGVNSPVRAFKAVDGSPLFIKRGNGAYIWDEDDNRFIDFCCSFGPLILGHNHPEVYKSLIENIENGTSFGAPTRLENTLAELILSRNTFIDKIRFVSSGTEAAMSAIRLARGFTGRNKIIKFEGCYHGHVDALLVKAGSGLATFGESSSAGVPQKVAEDTIVLPLDDIEAVEACLEKYKGEIACIALEPIPANNGLLIQEKAFLEKLRELCDKHGTLLFFDEVISGFRVAFAGAAELYGIQPDVVAYGKIIGGGLPVGAYGAKKEVMAHISPDGPVYQAGTLSGNPVAMSAGIAQLSVCAKPNFYEDQETRTLAFVNLVNEHANKKGYAFELVSIASIFWLKFGKRTIRRADEIDGDMTPFKSMHKSLLEKGVYLGPSGYEVGFISHVHTKNILDEAAAKFCTALDEIFG